MNKLTVWVVLVKSQNLSDVVDSVWFTEVEANDRARLCRDDFKVKVIVSRQTVKGN